MKPFAYRILPYEPAYEPQLLTLERESPQGRWISLEMLRDNFLSRSVVFDEFAVYVAFNPEGQLMGIIAGAIVPLRCNDQIIKMGIGYDLRVGRAFRGNGLSQKLGQHLRAQYFTPRNVKGMLMSMKASNHIIYKSAKILGMELYRYSFAYLTIPTNPRKTVAATVPVDEQFRVDLFPAHTDLTAYAETVTPGHTLWHTHLMYAVRIRKLHTLVNLPLRMADFILPKDRKLPREGDVLKFSVLCSDPTADVFPLRQTLSQLRAGGVDYLITVCKKNSATYRQLRPLAVNTYPYCLVSTYPFSERDRIVLDARCL